MEDRTGSDPKPSTSNVVPVSGPSESRDVPSMSTPLRHSPPYPPQLAGRSNCRRRSRRRSRRLTAFPPSQLGVLGVRDESFCDCPQQSNSRDLACKCGEEESEGFEWLWDKDSKSSASDLSEDKRDVKFHINYSSGTAAVRGIQSMTDRQHFWEIKMTTPVYGTDIMIGVGTPSVDLNASRYNFCSFLGKDAESWGFSYFGRAQHKGNFKYIEGSRFGQGSIIGVHLDMWHGSLSFYKNRKPLGFSYKGLSSKTLYPMVCSTAARTGMRLIRCCSFSTSLQFLCCQVLRKLIPSHLDVTKALLLPPGLNAFLTNNLSWLLRPSELETDKKDASSPRKRTREVAECDSDSDEYESDTVTAPKRSRISSTESMVSEEERVQEENLATTSSTDS